MVRHVKGLITSHHDGPTRSSVCVCVPMDNCWT